MKDFWECVVMIAVVVWIFLTGAFIAIIFNPIVWVIVILILILGKLV